jgi:hypothetical protein
MGTLTTPQKVIQASEEKYRTLIENSGQSIAVVLDRKIVYVILSLKK